MAEVIAEGVVLLTLRENLDREMAAAEAKVKAGMAAIGAEEAELRVKNEKAMKAVDQLKDRQEKAISDVAAAQEAGDKKAERLAVARLKTAEAGLVQWEKSNATLHKKLVRFDKRRTDLRIAGEKSVAKAAEAVARQVEKDAKAAVDAANKVAKAKAEAADRAAKAEIVAADKAAKAKAKSAADASKAASAAQVKAEREAAAATKKRETAEKAAAKAEADAAKAEAKATADAEKAKQREIAATTKKREASEKQIAKEEAAATRAATTLANQQQRERDREERASSRREALLEEEKGQVAQLTAKYAQLAKERRALERRESKITTSPSETISIRIQREGVEEAMLRLRSRLQQMNADPIHINVDVDDNSNALSNFASRIGETSVRLGPFTTTVGNTVRILATMGPVVLGLVSALGSLAAVAGGAAVGAIGALSASLVGFLPLAAGAGMALAPLIGDTKKVTDAAEKLTEAQIEYGKGSKEAKEAQKALNETLKNVDPASAKAAKGIAKIKREFDKLTAGPAREAFGRIMDSALESGNKLLPMFAKQTNKFMDTASKGLDGWMDRLSSEGGKEGLNNLFGNINDALGPLMSGLESLGAVVGRVLIGFSDHLPRVSKGFKDWAQALDETTASGDGVKNFVDSTMNSLSSFWGLLKSGGRVIAEFVRAATSGTRQAAPAIALVDDMTNTMNDWADSMSTVEGQSGIREFLNDFNDVARATYHAVEPLAKLFFELSSITRPLIQPLIEVVGIIGDLVAAVADFGPVRLMLQGAFGLFLAGALAGKIGGAITLFRQLATTIREVGAAAAGLKALNFLTGGSIGPLRRRANPALPPIGAPLPGPVIGRTAPRPTTAVRPGVVRPTAPVANLVKGGTLAAIGKTAAPIAATTAAATAATAAVGSFGLAATVAATGGLALLGGAVGYGVYKLISHKDAAEIARENVDKLGVAGLQAGTNFYGLAKANSDVGLGLMQTKLSLEQAKEALSGTKKGTDEHRQALINYRAALGANIDQQDIWRQQSEQQTQASKEQMAADAARVTEFYKGEGKSITALKERIAWDEKRLASGELSSQMEKDIAGNLADAREELGPLMAEEKRLLELREKSRNRSAAAALNIKREYSGLPAVLGDAEQALGRLARRNKPLAQKISVKYEAPKDVGRVAAQANRALSRGVSSKQVMRIVTDSRGAEADLRRLDRLGDNVTRKARKVVLNAADKATPVLAGVMRALGLYPKEKDSKLKATDDASNLIRGVVGRIIGIPDSSTTKVSAVDNALGIIGSITSAINAIPRQVTTNYSWTGDRPPGSVQGQATGGTIGMTDYAARGKRPAWADSRIKKQAVRAYTSASRKSPMPLGGGKVMAPRMVIGEERVNPEYVIATNPAYRDRNKRLLKSAANDLDMEPMDFAAKGGGPGPTKKKPRGKKAKQWEKVEGWYDPTPWEGKQPKSEKWWIPKQGWDRWSTTGQIYKSGGKGQPWVQSANGRFVPIDKHTVGNPRGTLTDKAARAGAVDPSISGEVINAFNQLTGSIKRHKEKLRTDYSNKDEPTKRKGKKKNGEPVETVDAFKSRLRTWNAAKKREKEALTRDQNKRDKLAKKYNLANLNNSVYTTMGSLRRQADGALDDMDTAGLKGDVNGFYAARQNRADLLDQLARKLNNAKKKAKSPYKEELEQQWKDAINDKRDTLNTAYSGGQDPLSMLNPAQAEQLRKINADISLSDAGQAAMYTDAYKGLLPGDQTPTAQEALPAFWQKRLDEAKATLTDKDPNNDASVDVIGAIAAELAAAKGGTSGGSADEPTITPGQMLNNERQSLLRDFGSNAYAQGSIGTTVGTTAPGGGNGTNPGLLADPFSGGDSQGSTANSIAAGQEGGRALAGRTAGAGGGGTGTQISGGGNTTQNIYVQPTYANVPEDPMTYTRNVGYEIGAAL